MDLEMLCVGATFHGRYRVLRPIKSGSMGAVYDVCDVNTGRRRALKVIVPGLVSDRTMRDRFEREAKITAEIESDHIVHVADAGVDEPTGIPFLVMDLLRGEELGTMIRRRKSLPPEDVVLYLSQAARALDKTHNAGIVHRDLKPENMFITLRDDGTHCLKILDFGIAKVLVESAQAQATSSMGTPLYMAPEQGGNRGVIRPAADIYALGQIAYTLLVGEPYWLEDATTLLELIMTMGGGVKEPPSARALRRNGPALPEAFDVWFLKAAALRPADRFESATAAVWALAQALSVTIPEPRTSTGDIAIQSIRPLSLPGSLPFAPTVPVNGPPGGGPPTANPFAPTEPALVIVEAPLPAPPDRSSDWSSDTPQPQVGKTQMTGEKPAREPERRSSTRRALSAAVGLSTVLLTAVFFFHPWRTQGEGAPETSSTPASTPPPAASGDPMLLRPPLAEHSTEPREQAAPVPLPGSSTPVAPPPQPTTTGPGPKPTLVPKGPSPKPPRLPI